MKFLQMHSTSNLLSMLTTPLILYEHVDNLLPSQGTTEHIGSASLVSNPLVSTHNSVCVGKLLLSQGIIELWITDVTACLVSNSISFD